jgi:uncharacterized membrane protein YedE/YeeE
MFFLKRKRWWPVFAGTAFAIVELFSFIFSEKPLGVTRGFTVTGSIIEYLISPEHSQKISYWESYAPVLDWAMLLALGLIVGGFISSRSSGDFKVRAVPELWKVSGGRSVAKRWIWTFIAGVMMGFAARMTGGCVSGLLISASIQLAPGGYIFMMALWIGAVLTTAVFYRGKGFTLKRE